MRIIDFLTIFTVIVLIFVSAMFVGGIIDNDTFLNYFTSYFVRLIIPFEFGYLFLVKFGILGILGLILMIFILRKNF